jgi:hypothetical protein
MLTIQSIRRGDWSVEEDPQSVVASLDKSIWGGMYPLISLVTFLLMTIFWIELALETWEEEEDGGR